MIKVCHMTSVHPAEDIRIFKKECVSLAKVGYDVTLIQQGESYEKDGVHLKGIGTLTGNRIKRMFQGSHKVYKAALEVDADLYHFHDPELLYCARKLKKKGKFVVFDSHEKYTMQLREKPYLPKWITVPISWLYGLIEKQTLKKIDGVIFPCTQNGIHPFEGLCKRFITLNNLPLLEELYDQWTAEEKPEFIACYVGYVRPDRGNTENVLACNQANVKLILAGGLSSEEYGQQLQQTDTKGLTEICGVVNRQQVLQVLKKSAVGLVTELNVGQNNIFDNLPTKAYEYMAMGLPVIISHSPYVDNLLKTQVFGIGVDPENINQIAEVITYLRENPEIAKQMGEAGRRAVKEEFNWGIEEQKLFALYDDILKS